jgi:phage shock protein C
MGIAEELERLQALRERGALSPEEFERAKARVLGSEEPGGPAHTSDAGTSDSGANDSGANGPGPDTATGAGTSFFRQLARSRSDRLLGGVCGGLGRHTDLPAWAWRLIFCLVTLYFGSGILFYVLLWIFLPLESAAAR